MYREKKNKGMVIYEKKDDVKKITVYREKDGEKGEDGENTVFQSKGERNFIIREMDESDRPREKLIDRGVGSLTDAELLAVLIRTGSAENNAIVLGQKILNRSNSGIRGLAYMDLGDFCDIKGIKKAKAAMIMAALELGRRVADYKPNRFRIKNPSDIHSYYMEELRYENREIFKVILLNTKNEIICDKNVSIGSLNYSIVHPREVFVEAIRRSANSIIIMHNHPSGNPSPSIEDIKVTKRLQECGKLIGIEVLDHVIIGDGVYCSLKEENRF